METYKNANELIEKELPRAIRSQLYPVFRRGVEAYKGILNLKGGTFQSAFIHNIKGSLLNFMIFRQFEADMVSATFPFVPFPEKVNSFKYTALNLLHNNIKINVGKAFTPDAFPNKSKYRKRYCQRNRFPDEDMFYGLNGAYDQLFISDEPYYVFLTFNLKNDELDFVNIKVPNWNMTTCLNSNINLKNEFSLYPTDDPKKKEDEKIITDLKKEFLQNFSIEDEVNE